MHTVIRNDQVKAILKSLLVCGLVFQNLNRNLIRKLF